MFKENRRVFWEEVWKRSNETGAASYGKGSISEETDLRSDTEMEENESALTAAEAESYLRLLEDDQEGNLSLVGVIITPDKLKIICDRALESITIDLKSLADHDVPSEEIEKLIQEAGEAIDAIHTGFKLEYDYINENESELNRKRDFYMEHTQITERVLHELVGLTGLERTTILPGSGGLRSDFTEAQGSIESAGSDTQSILAELNRIETESLEKGEICSFIDALEEIALEDESLISGDNPIADYTVPKVLKEYKGERYLSSPLYLYASDEAQAAFRSRVEAEFKANLHIQDKMEWIDFDMTHQSIRWQFQDPDTAKNHNSSYIRTDDAVAFAAIQEIEQRPEIAAQLEGRPLRQRLRGNKVMEIEQIPTFEQWHESMLALQDTNQEKAKAKMAEGAEKAENLMGKLGRLEAQLVAFDSSMTFEGAAGIISAKTGIAGTQANLEQRATPDGFIYYDEYSVLQGQITGLDKFESSAVSAYVVLLTVSLAARKATDLNRVPESEKAVATLAYAQAEQGLAGLSAKGHTIENLESVLATIGILGQTLNAAVEADRQAKRKDAEERLAALSGDIDKLEPEGGALTTKKNELVNQVAPSEGLPSANTDEEITQVLEEVTALETEVGQKIEAKRSVRRQVGIDALEARTVDFIASGDTNLTEKRDALLQQLKEKIENDTVIESLVGDGGQVELLLVALDAALAAAPQHSAGGAVGDGAQGAVLNEETVPGSAASRTGSRPAPVLSQDGTLVAPTQGPQRSSESTSGGPREVQTPSIRSLENIKDLNGFIKRLFKRKNPSSSSDLIYAGMAVLLESGSKYLKLTKGGNATSGLGNSNANIYERFYNATQSGVYIRVTGDLYEAAVARGLQTGDREKFQKQHDEFSEKYDESYEKEDKESEQRNRRDREDGNDEQESDNREYRKRRHRNERPPLEDFSPVISLENLPPRIQAEMDRFQDFLKSERPLDLALDETEKFFGENVIVRGIPDGFRIDMYESYESDEWLTFDGQIEWVETDDSVEASLSVPGLTIAIELNKKAAHAIVGALLSKMRAVMNEEQIIEAASQIATLGRTRGELLELKDTLAEDTLRSAMLENPMEFIFRELEKRKEALTGFDIEELKDVEGSLNFLHNKSNGDLDGAGTIEKKSDRSFIITLNESPDMHLPEIVIEIEFSDSNTIIDIQAPPLLSVHINLDEGRMQQEYERYQQLTSGEVATTALPRHERREVEPLKPRFKPLETIEEDDLTTLKMRFVDDMRDAAKVKKNGLRLTRRETELFMDMDYYDVQEFAQSLDGANRNSHYRKAIENHFGDTAGPATAAEAKRYINAVDYVDQRFAALGPEFGFDGGFQKNVSMRNAIDMLLQAEWAAQKDLPAGAYRSVEILAETRNGDFITSKAAPYQFERRVA